MLFRSYNQINTLANQTITSIQNASSGILSNAALTGIPTAPTASAGTNTTQIATTAFVNTAVSAVIDSAPSALNTLNELAAALNNDSSFASTIANTLSTKASLSGVETLTNKTISGLNNTITNIPNSALTNSSITINGTAVSLGGTLTISGTLPSASGQSGKFLYSDGTSASWQSAKYQQVLGAGTAFTARPTINFIGATVTDDSTNNRTNVTINATGQSSGFALLSTVESITGIKFF